MDSGTGQGVGTLIVAGGKQERLGAVEATEEHSDDNEVATMIDGVKDGGEGCAVGSMGTDVVTGHFYLALDVAGGHQGSSDTGGVVREDALMTAMGAGRDPETTVANRAMDVGISSAKDDIATLLGVVLAAGMEELGLVGGSSLGAVVKMGAHLQGSGFEQGDAELEQLEHTWQMWSGSTSTILEAMG
jgi:hypothetical protein